MAIPYFKSLPWQQHFCLVIFGSFVWVSVGLIGMFTQGEWCFNTTQRNKVCTFLRNQPTNDLFTVDSVLKVIIIDIFLRGTFRVTFFSCSLEKFCRHFFVKTIAIVDTNSLVVSAWTHGTTVFTSTRVGYPPRGPFPVYTLNYQLKVKTQNFYI